MKYNSTTGTEDVKCISLCQN